MSNWKTSTTVDGRTVSRLHLPALGYISDSLRLGRATSELNGWISQHSHLHWPQIGPFTVNHVILPTANGAHVYVPGPEDPNYREPFVNGKPAPRVGVRPDHLKLLVGAKETSMMSSESLLSLAEIITSAFQEFDNEMVKELTVPGELAHLKNYANHDLTGTVRYARFALGVVLLYNNEPVFPDKSQVLLKYANQGMDSFFAVRNCDQDRMLGLRVGSLAHTLRQQPRAMLDTHVLGDGSTIVKLIVTGASGALVIRDGLGLRIGGREVGSGVDEVITNQLEQIRLSNLSAQGVSHYNHVAPAASAAPVVGGDGGYLSLSVPQRETFVNALGLKESDDPAAKYNEYLKDKAAPQFQSYAMFVE
ncbi:P9 gene product [Spissistilus festinus reovirus]|uniref:P9 n=1 Tax=Spissistilus festinus reovirus TaxID=1004049 RepID=UPI00024D9474|nr:P9 gene product [Spissistilus festinus reovirus]AEC32495.1 P9 [Spissistilus festinus reovirus]